MFGMVLNTLLYIKTVGLVSGVKKKKVIEKL